MSLSDLTRPIIGIEYRTPHEVFDIMCGRLERANNEGLKPSVGESGWVLVPREPTDEMIAAVNREYGFSDGYKSAASLAAPRVWRVMVEAVPPKQCQTCGGRGEVGGWSGGVASIDGGGGYWSEACPDCAPPAENSLSGAQRSELALSAPDHINTSPPSVGVEEIKELARAVCEMHDEYMADECCEQIKINSLIEFAGPKALAILSKLQGGEGLGLPERMQGGAAMSPSASTGQGSEG